MARAETGVRGLDYVLKGGLPEGHVYLIEGAPGAGKSTLALQFLLTGCRAGQDAVYVTLSQTAEELGDIARSHGLNLSEIEVVELLASEVRERHLAQTVLHTAEEELDNLIGQIERMVDERRPSRIVIDSLSELRLISTSMLRFRRSILTLKTKMAAQHATTLLIDGLDELATTGSVELMTHGVIRLEWRVPDYGVAQRRLQVVKMRGSPFIEGFHDFTIATGGLIVFPRVISFAPHTEHRAWKLKSGDERMDALFGGSLPGNGTTLLTGETGAGKSVLCTLFAHTTAGRGIRTALFLFEERQEDFINRSRNLGMDLGGSIEDGILAIQQLDPPEISQGQLFHDIYKMVGDGARLIIIDSLGGFVKALSPGRTLLPQFTSLLNTLKRQNVAVLMTLNESAGAGRRSPEELDYSFLADNVIKLSRYQSELTTGRSLWIKKKRYGPHSDEVRSLDIQEGGVAISRIEGAFRVFDGVKERRPDSGG
ncbi:MAG: ATPase domain-containing protein [Alphaproteobacteria bacterium]